ncbi:MAG TPA: hypothetical protein VLX68_07835 [Chitinivibrionales bacterium]|nr:hypothetical protein [Chitinivibrionales bacterium]
MARWAGVMMAVLMLAAGCFAKYGPEKKFDLYITTGYGFGVGGSYLDPSQTFDAGSLIKREDHYRNFGWGIKLEGGADYLLMEKLAVQGGLCFNFGVPGISSIQDDGVGTKTTANYGWTTFGIKALLKPKFQVFDLFDVYTGFGIGLYFAFSSADITQTTATTNYSVKAIDGNNPALAFIGSLGAEYPLTESIILYGELYCEQMSFTTTQTTYSNSTFPNSYIKPVYYHEDEAGSPPPPKTPATNVAIRVGVRFPLF